MCVGVDANIVIVIAVFIGIDFSLIKYKSKPSQLLAFTKIKLEDFAKCINYIMKYLNFHLYR